MDHDGRRLLRHGRLPSGRPWVPGPSRPRRPEVPSTNLIPVGACVSCMCTYIPTYIHTYICTSYTLIYIRRNTYIHACPMRVSDVDALVRIDSERRRDRPWHQPSGPGDRCTDRPWHIHLAPAPPVRKSFSPSTESFLRMPLQMLLIFVSVYVAGLIVYTLPIPRRKQPKCLPQIQPQTPISSPCRTLSRRKESRTRGQRRRQDSRLCPFLQSWASPFLPSPCSFKS